MPFEQPVVQIVYFTASKHCLADPSLFCAVRNIAQGWKEKGLEAQYWGASVEKANNVFWFLLWKSHSHAAAIKTDPSYPAFTQNLQALATTPISEDCVVRMSGNPKRCLEGPVTELDVYKTDDEEPATTQEKIRRVTCRIESLQMQGFIALSWGVAAGDGTRGLYIAGWKTVEDHMRLGTLESHKVFVQETEEIFKNMKELIVAHVPLKRHDA